MATKYTNKLANKRVLVIGGSSGIGYGLCEALAEHGAVVFLSASNQGKLDSVLSTLRTSYPSAKDRISGHVCKLGGADAGEQVANLFSSILGSDSEANKLDHVVYTAGDGLAIKHLSEWDLESMQAAGGVRFFGPIFVAQQLPKALKPGPGSSFTITTGSIAHKPLPNWTVINGFGTGLLGLMRGFALDLAPTRVNAVAPGAVETELWSPQKKEGNFEQFAEEVKKMTTTNTFGQVEDVVEAYLYLLKDKNVTGTCIDSNSGVLLK